MTQATAPTASLRDMLARYKKDSDEKPVEKPEETTVDDQTKPQDSEAVKQEEARNIKQLENDLLSMKDQLQSIAKMLTEQQLKQAEPPKPKEEPKPAISFNKQELIEALEDDPAKAGELIASIIEKMLQSTPKVPDEDAIVERIMTTMMPTIYDHVRSNLAISRSVDEFYEANPNFVIYKPLVQDTFTKVAQEFPSLPLVDLLKKTKEIMKSTYGIEGTIETPKKPDKLPTQPTPQAANRAVFMAAPADQTSGNPVLDFVQAYKQTRRI